MRNRLRKKGKDKERKLSFELNTSIVCKEMETIKKYGHYTQKHARHIIVTPKTQLEENIKQDKDKDKK